MKLLEFFIRKDRRTDSQTHVGILIGPHQGSDRAQKQINENRNCDGEVILLYTYLLTYVTSVQVKDRYDI